MPLGDSITESAIGHASYRYWLWHMLADAGYTGLDFVGSMRGVGGGPPLYPDFDQDHEGHWGWRADHVLAEIDGWAREARPDIVLIHLGTNDAGSGQSSQSTIDELGQIIDSVRAVNPHAIFLVAQVIPWAGLDTHPLESLNELIPTLAEDKHTAESPVVVVDQWTGFDANADTWDGLHPAESGEKKMAEKWFTARRPFLCDGK